MSTIVRYSYAALGSVMLLLGLIGFVLPVMPGTVFLMVAAWAFARSVPAVHRWLHGHRWFGPVLKRWERERCVDRRPSGWPPPCSACRPWSAARCSPTARCAAGGPGGDGCSARLPAHPRHLPGAALSPSHSSPPSDQTRHSRLNSTARINAQARIARPAALRRCP